MEFAAISTVVEKRKISIDRFLNGESARSRVLIKISGRKYLLTRFFEGENGNLFGRCFQHAVLESFSYEICIWDQPCMCPLNHFERLFYFI